MTTTRAVGTLRRFHASAATDVPQEVWRLWTTPATWGEWDLGLREAHLDGPFVVGAQGTVTDRGGRTSPFRVTALEPGRRCVYEVPLVGARLELERTVDTAESGSGTVRHDVAFVGPAAPVWALLLGRGFRRQLGPTVDDVLARAARPFDA